MAGEDRLGAMPLFLGVETQYWTLAQFQQATQAAKAIGVTSLLVKVADGTNEWYGGINGRQQVLNAVIQAGLPAIAYTYCYGDSFGGLQGEVALLASIMQQNGIVVADMETEFNGQVNWAAAVCNALRGVSGAFSVTTWADPNLQNWQGVLSALAPCTDFFLPQVYNNFLAGVYQAQYAPYGRPYYPILNLGDDFGANDIIQIAKAANKSIVGFWEYQAAITTHASIVKQLATQVNGGDSVSGVPQGWHYDDKTKVLTAPNGTQVTDGFAQWILTHTWAADDLPRMGAIGLTPVEIGNPALGGGTVQPFNKTILAWTQKAGVYPMYAGKEYIALYQLLSKLQADYKAAQSQITSLQQQVKQLQEQQPTPQPASNIDVNEAISIINAVEVALANLKQELGK
jgi:hypothetical protein